MIQSAQEGVIWRIPKFREEGCDLAADLQDAGVDRTGVLIFTLIQLLNEVHIGLQFCWCILLAQFRARTVQQDTGTDSTLVTMVFSCDLLQRHTGIQILPEVASQMHMNIRGMEAVCWLYWF